LICVAKQQVVILLLFYDFIILTYIEDFKTVYHDKSITSSLQLSVLKHVSIHCTTKKAQ